MPTLRLVRPKSSSHSCERDLSCQFRHFHNHVVYYHAADHGYNQRILGHSDRGVKEHGSQRAQHRPLIRKYELDRHDTNQVREMRQALLRKRAFQERDKKQSSQSISHSCITHNHEVDHHKTASKDFRITREPFPERLAHEGRSQPLSAHNLASDQSKHPLSNAGHRGLQPIQKAALSLLDAVARGQAKRIERRHKQNAEVPGSKPSNTLASIGHKGNKDHKATKIDTRQPSPRSQNLSLFEELFPEESKRGSRRTQHQVNHQQRDLPRLPPPDLDALDISRDHLSASTPQLIAREAMANAYRQENPTVLVLSRASLSLVESDFRRVAPKGMHIEEWRGLGDILKGNNYTVERCKQSRSNSIQLFPQEMLILSNHYLIIFSFFLIHRTLDYIKIT